jgi:hypothetical protein
MKIKSKDKYFNQYEAEVVDFEALQDFMFKVSYYDDEGILTTEVVDHKRLVSNNQLKEREHGFK